MKFGSVKFFKALILSVWALLLVVCLALAIFFGIAYGGEKRRGGELEQINRALTEHLLETLTPEELEELLPVVQEPGPEPEPEPALEPPDEPSFAYQALYPELYAPETPGENTEAEGEKVCYLTFDDGPSAITGRVLDTLEEYGVKATFFVTGEASEENPEMIQAAAKAGHTIGVHTWSHDYDAIYASVEDFLADFDRMFRRIQELTGQAPSVFRFAGGSVNSYNRRVYPQIVAEMLRRGFVFYDWNAAASDAVVGGVSAAQAARNALNSAAGEDRLIILMHDRLDTASTAAALPTVIAALQEEGYRFAPLTPDVKPITFYYG